MKAFKLFFLVSISLFILLPTPSGFANDKDTAINIATRLQERYNKFTSLDFSFTQKTHGNLTGRPRQASGRAIFFKDKEIGKMRWDYVTPDVQVIISDGSTLSMYFANQQQMIVTPAHSLQQDVTYTFFSGKGNILQDFDILPADNRFQSTDATLPSLEVIQLVPKSNNSQVKSIHAWISPTSLIQRLEMTDHFDTITILNFIDLKVDALAMDQVEDLNTIFSFTPPEGTEIIHQ